VTVLDWDGCVNVRDLGGIPTEDGRRTRTGSVVRSDNIGFLTAAGWRALEAHGVTRIVDLRWPEEVAEDPPRDVDIEVVHVSVLGRSLEASAEYLREHDLHLDTIEDSADHYAWAYVDFLERNRERFGRAFAAIAEADGTVVVHCMGGKDRTGLVAGLLLRLGGVSLEELGRDYALSGPNLQGTLGTWLESAPDAVERARREKLSDTPARAMEQVVAEVERHYGDVAGYLRAAGLADEQIDQLRRRLR
jgi:protein tyrosine/serine phosphatase